MQRVYLDNAATTPLDPVVLETMLPYMQQHFGNPSSTHSFGRETRSAIEKARKKIAAQLHVSPGEIFFTSGGTEANNIAIQCSVRDLGIRRIISSAIEHHAVTHTVEAMEKKEAVTVDWVQLHADGSVNYDHLESLLQQTDTPTLVSLMHANNEIGVLLDIERVANLCKEYQALFHCDTVQTVAHYPLDLSAIPVHFISAAAHKFHGPKGVGFLYIHGDVHIEPLILGGAQERNMRAGTENLYGIIGLAKAMELAYDELESTRLHIESLKHTMKQLLVEHFPGVRFNSPDTGLYTVLNVQFPPHPKNDLLIINLDIQGVACSGGSACSSGSNTGSHVINFLQTPEGTASVRFSFSKFNTEADIQFAVEQLLHIFRN
jgi:cysteine desulfurase